MPIKAESSFGLACLQVFTKMTISLPINSYFICHCSVNLSLQCLFVIVLLLCGVYRRHDSREPCCVFPKIKPIHLFVFRIDLQLPCFHFFMQTQLNVISDQQCFIASEIFKRPGKIRRIISSSPSPLECCELEIAVHGQ